MMCCNTLTFLSNVIRAIRALTTPIVHIHTQPYAYCWGRVDDNYSLATVHSIWEVYTANGGSIFHNVCRSIVHWACICRKWTSVDEHLHVKYWEHESVNFYCNSHIFLIASKETQAYIFILQCCGRMWVKTERSVNRNKHEMQPIPA